MFRSHLPRWLKISIVVYLAYVALMLLVATPLLNMLAPKIYRAQTGRELQLGKIAWINPFTLALTVRSASSANADHTPFWSLDEFNANISLASLWRGHIVLDGLTLRGLALQIDQTAPDRFNFSDILDYRAKHFPQPNDNAAKTKSAANFAIDISALDITAKQFGFRASHSERPIKAMLADINLTLKNFSAATATTTPASLPTLRADHIELAIAAIDANLTRERYPFTAHLQHFKIALPAFITSDNSAYTLSLLDGSGGSIDIKGSAAIAHNSANGQAQLRGISVLPAWQLLADKLAFDMGNAQTGSHAKLDGEINYNVNWANSALNYQLDHSQLALRDAQLQARNDSESHVGFSALRISDIQVDSAQPLAHIGKVVVDKLAVAGWNKESQVSLVDMFAFPSSDEPSDSPPWQIQVDDIAVQNGDVRWRASQIEHLPLTLAPLDIHLNNLHWPDTAPLQLDAKTTINNTAQLGLNGTVIPSTRNGEINADVQDLPLAWGDVFVRQQMRATLTGGTLSARATIKLDNAQPIAVQSDGAIDQFELQPLAQVSPAQATLIDKRKLVSWQKLEWRQLAIAPQQQRINIKQVLVTQPWAQFRINTDGTNNFQQLLIAPKNSEVAKTALTPNLSPAGRGELSKPWQFAIDNIHIDHATLDFRDASLVSAFRTNLTELTGDIDGLDSGDSKRLKSKAAKVGLRGTVDGYAPVALSGQVDPFATKPALNITLDMTNLDLATLTPYSGTYAGYQIDGGRLTVQLVYTLENGRIIGKNHIIVNQMVLGKQVSGPKVMDLPLRLAIYLLTDSKGVMDLGVDVTGDVDDPDFSVGSIIWKAFRNLIVKTATSPFRALARIAGSDRDDLDHVDFTAGSSQPVAGETEKLREVTKAMQQKSELKLAITGHVAPSHDLEALSDNTLSEQLIAQGGITPSDIQKQSPNWQREVVKLFKKRFPDIKTDQWQVMQMNDAMRDNIELPSNALQELAAQRALAVKQTLAAKLGLAADRAFVKPVDIGADKSPGAFVTLQVE